VLSNDSFSYNEDFSIVKKAIFDAAQKYTNSKKSEKKEFLFKPVIVFHAKTDYETDYGQHYHGYDLVWEGNKYGDTRLFYMLGVTLEPHNPLSWIQDKKEPRDGIFDVCYLPQKGKTTKRQMVHEIDFITKHKKNMEIGEYGEKIVLEYEKKELKRLRKPELADMVSFTKDTLGNTAPYDILSFTEDGEEKHIEVKATQADFNSPFYISSNEMKFAEENKDTHYLYRVYNIRVTAQTAKLVIIKNILDVGIFEPSQYKVTL